VGHGSFRLHRLTAMTAAAACPAGVTLGQGAGADECERRKKCATQESQN
jgi:hypothetical protein